MSGWGSAGLGGSAPTLGWALGKVRGRLSQSSLIASVLPPNLSPHLPKASSDVGVGAPVLGIAKNISFYKSSKHI